MIYVIILCIVGFTGWSFLQRIYTIDNGNIPIQLYWFPIFVPLIASLFVSLYFISFVNKFDIKKGYDSFIEVASNKKNILIWALSAFFLSISYILYPKVVNASLLNVIVISIGITTLLTAMYFFVDYKGDKVHFGINAENITIKKIIGIILSVVGIILMKGGK